MNPFVADPHWGWWIILYFYLGGLAAGAYFLGTLVELFGQEQDRVVSRIGYRIAFPLVLLCGLFLTVDLERPERFWHMLLQSEVADQALAEGWPRGGWETMGHAAMLKIWSPMSIGAWALFIFGICSFISFVGSLWPQGNLARVLGRTFAGHLFQILASGVGFFIASYTGVLVEASNQPLWSVSAWIGPLFLTSAASTGMAAVVLLARTFGGESAATEERLERADLWSLGLELFIFLIFLASLGNVLPLALQTPAGIILVFGTLLLGLLFPLALHLGVGTPGSARIVAAAALSLIGGFALRFGIVRVAAELLGRMPPTFVDDLQAPLWDRWEGKALVAVTALLAVLIPLILMQQWRLSLGQTALAGVASVLVLGGVLFYSLTPASAQPALELPRGERISPEDGRARNGGPGASVKNRPATPHPRSKYFEATAP